MPLVDQRIYTGSNADMAWAYLHAAQAFGKATLKNRALHVLTQIVTERFDMEKGVAHGKMSDIITASWNPIGPHSIGPGIAGGL